MTQLYIKEILVYEFISRKSGGVLEVQSITELLPPHLHTQTISKNG
jgi:hypothetical protein